jgi:hypothetical protein
LRDNGKVEHRRSPPIADTLLKGISKTSMPLSASRLLSLVKLEHDTTFDGDKENMSGTFHTSRHMKPEAGLVSHQKLDE